MKLSVVVPMLNEERAIGQALAALGNGAPAAEVIVVDGGSSDRSIEIARMSPVCLLEAKRGRACQMNVGAAAAHGDILAFVHADTLVPPTFADNIQSALDDRAIVGGRFDLELDDRSPACRALGWLINFRSRIMRSATGDQVIFVRRELFDSLGGFPEIDLCEDVDFARRMRRAGPVACLRTKVVTSARRWRRDGILRTVIRMWAIKSLFLAGVSPLWLKRHYADTR